MIDIIGFTHLVLLVFEYEKTASPLDKAGLQLSKDVAKNNPERQSSCFPILRAEIMDLSRQEWFIQCWGSKTKVSWMLDKCFSQLSCISSLCSYFLEEEPGVFQLKDCQRLMDK